MENFNAPFRFDYVGSFLRPAHLKQARADFEAGQITKAELESIENEAITDLIKKQKAAGYPVITDGEFRRSYWHLDFMWGLEGIEHIELDHGYFFHGEETTHGSVRVTGKISGEQHPFVEHFKFVKQFEDEHTIARQTIPAPAQLLAELFREDNGTQTLAVYPDLEELIQRTLHRHTGLSSGISTMQDAETSNWTTVHGACSATKITGRHDRTIPSAWKKRLKNICG